jgi:hypothetical protein
MMFLGRGELGVVLLSTVATTVGEGVGVVRQAVKAQSTNRKDKYLIQESLLVCGGQR